MIDSIEEIYMTTKLAFGSCKMSLSRFSRYCLLIAGPCAIVGLLAAFIVLGDSKRESSGRLEARSSEVPTQAPAHALPIQTVRFTLYPQGIYPRKTTAHKGVVAIAVDDLVATGSTLVVVKLTGNDRVSIGQVRRSQNHRRGRGLLHLTPGDYRISIVERPEQEAELTVEP
jgi:hypothetical protein